MEIVAKKYPRMTQFIVVLVACILMLAVGVVFILYDVLVSTSSEYFGYFGFALAILGVILTAMMVFSIVRFKKLPENVITFEDGVFTFPKGKHVNATDIKDVIVDYAKPAYRGVSYDFGFGLITVFTATEKIKAYYVASPDAVYKRVKEIVKEAKLLAKNV